MAKRGDILNLTDASLGLNSHAYSIPCFPYYRSFSVRLTAPSTRDKRAISRRFPSSRYRRYQACHPPTCWLVRHKFHEDATCLTCEGCSPPSFCQLARGIDPGKLRLETITNTWFAKKARGRTFVSGTRKYAYTNAHVQRPPQMKKTEERRLPWSGLTMYGVMTAMI
jgi:hypothetical protein